MRLIVWDSSFKRAFRRVVRNNPRLEETIFEVLELLVTDPFMPTLKSHKLRGDLAGL